MHNILTEKRVAPVSARPPAAIPAVQDISVKPFNLSQFASRRPRKKQNNDPRQMLLWAPES